VEVRILQEVVVEIHHFDHQCCQHQGNHQVVVGVGSHQIHLEEVGVGIRQNHQEEVQEVVVGVGDLWVLGN
jgi:hypothetical protein